MDDVTCFLYILYVITPPRSNISCEDMPDIPMTLDDDRRRQFLLSVQEISMTARPAYLRMRPAPDDFGRSPAGGSRRHQGAVLAPEAAA